MMLDRVGHFWHQHVETGVEPPLVGSEARKYLACRFPTHGQEMMRATEADERLLLELSAVRHAERETAQAREAIENTLKARIGEHRGMQGLTTRATWALTKDSERVDWKAVAADLYGRLAFHGMANAEQFAALTAAHTTVSPGVRRFLFTEKSE
jgi:predicted phage-related endonuclease